MVVMGCGEDADVMGAKGGLLRVWRFGFGCSEVVAFVGCGKRECCGRGEKQCMGGGYGQG